MQKRVHKESLPPSSQCLVDYARFCDVREGTERRLAGEDCRLVADETYLHKYPFFRNLLPLRSVKDHLHTN